MKLQTANVAKKSAVIRWKIKDPDFSVTFSEDTCYIYSWGTGGCTV